MTTDYYLPPTDISAGLTDQQYCDLLNGLNLLIEMNDSQPGHYNDIDKWRKLIALSQGIYLKLICRPGNTVLQCTYCEGDHQFSTDAELLDNGYDGDGYVMCQSCICSQEG